VDDLASSSNPARLQRDRSRLDKQEPRSEVVLLSGVEGWAVAGCGRRLLVSNEEALPTERCCGAPGSTSRRRVIVEKNRVLSDASHESLEEVRVSERGIA